MKKNHQYFMRMAINQAKIGKKLGYPPIGAIIVNKNKIISQAYNQKDQLKDATAHAEIIAIRKAGKLLGPNLKKCTLYVTLKPCLMCLTACYWAHIEKIYYGAGREAGKKYFETKKELESIILSDLNLRKIKIKGGVLKNECLKLYR
ncbi:MAG: nucleoside deaminase [Microgenomates group bacterium]|nr:nucleoside deaminase [Microgenomates group bacterium]